MEDIRFGLSRRCRLLFRALHEADSFLDWPDSTDVFDRRWSLCNEYVVSLDANVVIEVLRRENVRVWIAPTIFLILDSSIQVVVNPSLLASDQGFLLLLVVIQCFQKWVRAEVGDRNRTICRGRNQMAALLSVWRPSILVADMQLLNGLSVVRVNQRNWQNVVFHFLKHWNQTYTAIVGSNDQRRQVFIEESHLLRNLLVCEEKVKLQPVEVALNN